MRGTNAFIRSVTIRVAVPRWLGEKGVGVGDSLREGWKGEDTESITGEPFLRERCYSARANFAFVFVNESLRRAGESYRNFSLILAKLRFAVSFESR